MSNPDDYFIGIVCAIATEFTAVQLVLDEIHDPPSHLHINDGNSYALGRVGKHNVVVAVLPDGEYGESSATVVSRDMMHSFPNIKIGLMVGIAGGAPTSKVDIRLGDVVVSSPKDGKSGVLQYDFGRTIQEREFQLTRHLNQPPGLLRTAVSGLRTKIQLGLRLDQKIDEALHDRQLEEFTRPLTDRLFDAGLLHKGDDDCRDCEPDGEDSRSKRPNNGPVVHYGLIASANTLMKDAVLRQELSEKHNILCFEMEAAGLTNNFPCLVIRGISDYADTHKNKAWQGYAALAAAVYAKELLYLIVPSQLQSVPVVQDVVSIKAENFRLPFSLPGAPLIDTFSGRLEEMARIEEVLQGTDRQVLVIEGSGGMGKTQLAIAFAKKHKEDYHAILWLNGIDETSLKNSFVGTARRLAQAFPTRFEQIPQEADSSVAINAVLHWLDKRENQKWLMIFDNVDEPDIPGSTIKGLYDVRKFFPSTLHGHIMITTRCAQLRLGKQIHIAKITDPGQCLEMLRNTSMRPKIDEENKICDLLKRLDGLPLALSAAGSYLHQVTMSVEQYLNLYNNSWLELQQATPALSEYEGRTLEVTWQITANQIKRTEPVAWQLMVLLSFFSNQDIWYELLYAGRAGAPQWFQDVTESDLKFTNHMRVLCTYGLVDAQRDTHGYSLHNCLQDWLRATTSTQDKIQLSPIAMFSVARTISRYDRNWLSLSNSQTLLRLSPHVINVLRYKAFLAKQEEYSPSLWRLTTLYPELTGFLRAYSIIKKLSKEIIREGDRVRARLLSIEQDLSYLRRVMHQLDMDYELHAIDDYAKRLMKRLLDGLDGDYEFDPFLPLRGPRAIDGTHASIEILNQIVLIPSHQRLMSAEELSDNKHKIFAKNPACWLPLYFAVSTRFAIIYQTSRQMERAAEVLGLVRSHLNTFPEYSQADLDNHLLTLAEIFLQSGKLAEAYAYSCELCRVAAESPGSNLNTIDTSPFLGLVQHKAMKFNDPEQILTYTIEQCEEHFGPGHSTITDTFKLLVLLRFLRILPCPDQVGSMRASRHIIEDLLFQEPSN